VIEQTKNQNKVAYYLDMGLGKTFVGSEKMKQLHSKVNLVICQKSKVKDWVEHFYTYYDCMVFDGTNKHDLELFIEHTWVEDGILVCVINYELAFRRGKLADLSDFTLMLDESSLIQNETAKRSKFILKKLNPKNVILLSGTPTSGKYEKLWSQMHLLGWNISKDMYYRQYVDMRFDGMGYPYVAGYKNVDRLKKKMREHGCVFMKTEEVLDLPQQNFIDIRVDESKEYKKFMKSGIVQVHTGVYDHQCGSEWDGKIYDDLHELVGDTTLTKLLYARQLCGMYSKEKLNAFKDLVDSTEDRLIVFYNFNDELEKLKLICEDRHISIVNGSIKDLQAYNKCDNSITFIQYQAGAMGLNLQLANKIVYFTPPLYSELFEQSKKRIHRIGQEKPCFYYQLKCGIEYHIYDVLSMRKDYTDELFVEVL
jgi:SNF2 family DNA or RNA helicase